MGKRLNNRYFFSLLEKLPEDSKAMVEFYESSIKVAKRCIKHISKRKGLELCSFDLESAAIDAVATVYERIQRGLTCESYYTYLYLQCKHEVLHRTHAQNLEKYCIKHNINFFDLSEEERELVKEKARKNEGGKG